MASMTVAAADRSINRLARTIGLRLADWSGRPPTERMMCYGHGSIFLDWIGGQAVEWEMRRCVGVTWLPCNKSKKYLFVLIFKRWLQIAFKVKGNQKICIQNRWKEIQRMMPSAILTPRSNRGRP